jgi:hypothetical protein
MPYLRKTTLIRRSVAKALRSPLNILAGMAGLGAAWWLHDPMPAMAWGAGAAGWAAIATATWRYRPRIEEEERRKREAREGRERELARQRTARLLEASPLDVWTHAGYLPDYLGVFRRLAEIRDRVSALLAERQDLDAFTKEDILQQLGTMLTAYLGFVRERASFLLLLVDGPALAQGAQGWRRDWRRLSARIAPVLVPPVPSLEKRLSEVDEKIRRVRELSAREPATARTRQFHIGVLEKQRELLLDRHERDQCVVAQLGAFSDAFEVIHGRLSGSQFDATEVASYMSQLVEQIVETERFVETLRPSMDGFGLDPGMTGRVRQAGRG